MLQSGAVPFRGKCSRVVNTMSSTPYKLYCSTFEHFHQLLFSIKGNLPSNALLGVLLDVLLQFFLVVFLSSCYPWCCWRISQYCLDNIILLDGHKCQFLIDWNTCLWQIWHWHPLYLKGFFELGWAMAHLGLWEQNKNIKITSKIKTIS